MANEPEGYSGKPIWRKLGLSPLTRVLVRNAPADYAHMVGMRADEIAWAKPRGTFDVAHIFASSAKALEKELVALCARLPAQGVIWVSWPKKASKVATDVTEDSVRALALPLGLVDIKVCAIDAVWSGLKLVWRREHRADKS